MHEKVSKIQILSGKRIPLIHDELYHYEKRILLKNLLL